MRPCIRSAAGAPNLRSIVLLLVLAVTAPAMVAAAPATGTDPTCGLGSPVTATHGAGDASIPTLVYAALKTGFRAVVTWETAELSQPTLSISINGGTPQILRESAPRRHHVFVIDGLPVGKTLCFKPQGSATMHALRLGNAMNAWDGTRYTANFLVLANEQPEVGHVEASLDRFAEQLYDATDGYVRAGRIITLYGDVLNHNSGWATCYVAGIIVQRAGCYHYYDVLFTNDAAPQGAASTYADAIRDPEQAIWMNGYHQANLVRLNDDTGQVLNHEMGHYLFGAQDLYGAITGTDPDCWDPAKGLSVMGGNRGASEYDDEVNRCPNAAGIGGYVPTWTLFRQDFTHVPARSVIDAGPSGDGGAYVRHSLFVSPQAGEIGTVAPVGDGTGSSDASDEPARATRIERDTTYTGTMPPGDLSDMYAFHAEAGELITLTLTTSAFCPYIAGPDATGISYTCTGPGTQRVAQATAKVSGTHYAVIGLGATPVYQFRVDVA